MTSRIVRLLLLSSLAAIVVVGVRIRAPLDRVAPTDGVEVDAPPPSADPAPLRSEEFPFAPLPQVLGLCPTLPNGHPRQAPGHSAPGPAASAPSQLAAAPQVSGFKSQVSNLLPPTAADEDALLRLLDEAKREANAITRRERLVAICLRWAAFDPPAAISLALDSGLDPLAGALVPNLAQQWAAQDFSAAQAWAEKLLPGELRDEVYSRLAYEQSLTSPSAAARLLTRMRPTGPAHDEATLSVVHAWAQRDLTAASAWVHTFAAGVLRERALTELAAVAP